MDERSTPIPAESPPVARRDGGQADAFTDPRVLQILSTEHWSLLSARSLVYNEAFARAGTFLSFLSATLVALGLIATATGFNDGLLGIAAVLLAMDLFIGYATLGRIVSASSEEIRFLQAMNRIRHAYVDMAPSVAPYFMTGHHDDFWSVLSIYGPSEPGLPASPASARVRVILHGFTTTPGMIGTITSAVGGALAAVLTMLATHAPTVAGVAGLGTFLVLFGALMFLAQRSFVQSAKSLEAMFPKDRTVR